MYLRVAAALSLLLLAGPVSAQMGTQPATPREVDGVVRLNNRAAPGVMVFLDYAPSRDAPPPAASGELGRALTDSSGRFHFHLNPASRAGSSGLFAITAHYAGYKDAFQVVDLTFSPHATAALDLARDTSKDLPNVPPGGPADTISVHRPPSSEAQAALRKGQQLLVEKHDSKASIESLKKAVKLDPTFGPAFVLLGAAYVQQGDWPDAKSAFENASKLEPKNSEALLGLGVTLNAQQDFSGAQKCLQHSLELNPGSAEAHYELGKSLWAQKKWQEAEPHASQAVAINKDFPPAHVLMGNIYLRRRDAASALKEFNEYLRLDPTGHLAAPVKEMVQKIQRATGQR